MKTDDLVVTGCSASPGMCMGDAFVLEIHDLESALETDRFLGVEKERSRFESAVSEAIAELQRVKERTIASLGEEAAHIFRSQQTVLEDESTRSEIIDTIGAGSVTASRAVCRVYDGYLALFSDLDENDYNKARMADIVDVKRRVLRVLLGIEEQRLDDSTEKRIVVAEELFPSDTALLDKERILGFVTERGGVTSHVAILAKNLGIPAAVGATEARARIATGQTLFLDTASGETAEIVVDPPSQRVRELDERIGRYRRRIEAFTAALSLSPETEDGALITLSANIGSPEEARIACSNGARSVGLFRTEFLFLGKDHIPDEAEQYEAYRTVAELFAPGMVLIRSLDIGGDKSVPALSLPEEANPFLGYRGLRICLGQPDLFRTQLRAVFRANETGNIKLMFPMVSSVEEVVEIAKIREEVIAGLEREGVKYNAQMEFGIMVELPSTLFVLEELGRYVDFFSIGTNDLTQYLFGADRMNESVSRYYQEFGPAVFRAVDRIVESAHRNGKWVGVCGELAGNPEAVPILIGLGVDELSMSSPRLGEATHIVRSIDRAKARATLVPRVLESATEEEVRNVLADYATD